MEYQDHQNHSPHLVLLLPIKYFISYWPRLSHVSTPDKRAYILGDLYKVLIQSVKMKYSMVSFGAILALSCIAVSCSQLNLEKDANVSTIRFYLWTRINPGTLSLSLMWVLQTFEGPDSAVRLGIVRDKVRIKLDKLWPKTDFIEDRVDRLWPKTDFVEDSLCISEDKSWLDIFHQKFALVPFWPFTNLACEQFDHT